MKYFKQIITILLLISIVINFYALLIGFETFYAGWHNLDLAYNMNYLEETLNVSLMDTNSAGNLWNSNDMHQLGLKQIKKGLNKGYVSITIILSCMYGLTLTKKG